MGSGGWPLCDPHPHPAVVPACPGVAEKVEQPKYKKDKQLNEKLSLFRGDITKLEVDAIVNAGEWTAASVTSAPGRPRGKLQRGSGARRGGPAGA